MIRTTSVLGLLVLLAVQAFASTVHVDESICITDAKQKASLEALNAACKETGADPMEIIRLGLEKFKQQTNQQKPNATEIVRPEFDYYGLNSLFDEGDQANEDDEEDDYGLNYLFNESNHSSGSQVHHQTEQRVNKSSTFEEHHEDYYDLNRLYNENWSSTRSHKKNSTAKLENPMDSDTDFGLRTLFNETDGKQTSPPVERVPPQGSQILDAEPAPVDRVQSLYGKPDVPAIEISANKMAENLRLPQFSSPWDMDGQDQDEYGDDDYEEDSLFDVPTTEKPPQEPKMDEKPSKLTPQEPSEPAKPTETAPSSKPALDKSEPGVSSKPDNAESKPIHDEKSAGVEHKSAEAKSVDTHIDYSDPSDSKKVHIERRTESNVDPTGAINHVHEETRTSSSLNGDKSSKQHYSRRSSHSSTSYSSSFASPNNGRPRKNNHRNKNKNKMQNKPGAYSAIPPLPPMVLPVIPMMPYNPAQQAWPGFYNPAAGQRMSNRQMKRLQQQQQGRQHPYASAYAGAGLPGATATAYAGSAGAYAGPAGAYAGPAGAYAGSAGAFAGAGAPYPYGPTGNYNYNNNNNNNRRRSKNARRRAKHQAEQQHTAAKQQY